MKIDVVETPRFNTQRCCIGSHHWNVARLAKLSEGLEVMDIPLAHLNVWSTYDRMSLRELAGHVKATNEADMSKPIILDEDGVLMDGRHRIMRALIDGSETIKAVRFSINPKPCEISDE